MQIPERDELLANAQSICSIIEDDADQSEADRTLAMTSVEALSDAGLMSMCLPRSLGGFEADPMTQTELYEVISEANGAAGWCCFIGATVGGMVGGMIGEGALPQVFKDGQTLLASGSTLASGKAERIDGGYRVSGRWAFGSGIHHANWISTVARVTKNGEIVRLPNGVPEICMPCLPVKDVVIEDNWYANGLCGTGSSHYRIEDVFVPDDFVLRRDPAPRGGALFRMPIFGYVSACSAGFALGVAKRAMKEIIAIAENKRRALSGQALSDRGAFHKELGVIACKLAAARAYSFDILNQIWEATCNDEQLSLIKWGECRAAMTYVTEVAAETVTFAYRYGAGAALYQSHPLQRCLRDIYTGIQHGLVSDENYESLGLALIGRGKWEPMIGGPPTK
jgi:alkylation response protein AidB-like acyl-CoA dehydrogenase